MSLQKTKIAADAAVQAVRQAEINWRAQARTTTPQQWLKALVGLPEPYKKHAMCIIWWDFLAGAYPADDPGMAEFAEALKGWDFDTEVPRIVGTLQQAGYPNHIAIERVAETRT